MKTSKLILSLGLTLILCALPSCTGKDHLHLPSTPETISSEVKIVNGVLISYGSGATPTDGIVRLDKEQVHTIGAGAFAGNTHLKEIHAPGVTKIDAGAFKGCSSLMKVDFGAGQHPPFAINEQDKSTYTAEDAFWGTPEDKVLTFNPKANPNYLVYLEYIARHHFAKLDGIEIPTALPSAYAVKDGVLTRIKDNNALSGRGRNGVLILPSNIKKIGEGVFGDKFQNFKAIYGEGVETIEDNAFVACYSLQFVHFPQLKSIGEQVFSFNGRLEALNFPHLETIADLAFNSYGAVNPIRISYLSLPQVKKIGKGVLEGKYEVQSTVLLGSQPQVDFTPYKDSYTLTDGKWHGFSIKEIK